MNKIESKVWSFMRRNLSIVLIVAGVAAFRTAFADWSSIPSGSMEPTFLPGDYVWIDKLAYGPSVPFANIRLATWGTPERGDIITFVPPHTDELYIKRVIGVPGDRIRIAGAEIHVNGERLPASLRAAPNGRRIGIETIDGEAHRLQYSTDRTLPSFREFTVPAKRYFVLGDHRDDSVDSRAWGFVEADHIMGRVRHVAVSFSSERPLRERIALPVN